MPPPYTSFAELAAENEYGVDYRIEVEDRRTKGICIAIHGGGIEVGTTELARSVSAWSRQGYYNFEGLRPSNNSELHITSTLFDEPTGLAAVAKSDYCFSVHGMADQTPGTPETYVGGLDITARDAVIDALVGAGFNASIASVELGGTSPNNIANRNRREMGVQLELSSQQRRNFFIDGDWSRANRETGLRTDDFWAYVKAISSVFNDFAGSNQTQHYRLNRATQEDKMYDFETYLNSNWDKIALSASPPKGTVLPSEGNYKVGDRFYKTDTKSIYLLACRDTNWGWHWRPVQDAISPWVTVPETCLDTVNDGENWNLDPVGNPFQIALDNRGKCYWRGVISRDGGIPRAVSHGVFKPLPIGIKPRERGAFMVGHSPLSVGTSGTNLNAYQGARLFLFGNEVSPQSIRVFGGTADPTHIYLTGVHYAVGAEMFISA